MPGFILLILPALAVIAMLVLVCRPLFILANIKNLDQAGSPDANGLRQKATKRGQEDEYDTLITLGFQPIGVYQESVPGTGVLGEQFVLVHDNLPVTCSLCRSCNGQVYIVMTSDGASGVGVRTSSISHDANIDTVEYFSQTVDAESTEEIFVAHVKALDQFEDRGLEPVQIKSMNDVMAHYLRSFLNPAMQKYLRNTFLEVAIGSLFLTTLFPLLPSVGGYFMVESFGQRLGIEIMTQVYCALSLFVSIGCIYATSKRSKTLESSLAPVPESESQASQAIETLQVDHDHNIGAAASTRFVLPFRDSSGARLSAFQPIMMSMAIGTLILVLAFQVGVFWFFLGVAVVACGVPTVGALMLSGIALGLGHTKSEIEVSDDSLRWIERAYFLQNSNRFKTSDICKIEVELLEAHPGLWMGVFGEHARNKRAYVLCLYESVGDMHTLACAIAPAYSEEVLTRLAIDLGDALGLANKGDSRPIQISEHVQTT